MLMMGGNAVAAPLGGWLSDRVPPAYLTTLALLIVAGVMGWCAQLDADATVVQVALRLITVGVGMGLFQAANATLIMSSVPHDQLGTGGALLAMSRSMGTVSSVALMGALFASRLNLHTLALAQQGITATTQSGQVFVLAFRDTYWASTILAAIAVLISLSYWPRQRNFPRGRRFWRVRFD
jgi:MFS family permease